ncbi:MAG TPA: hypothetical protein VLD57_02695, partial [Blastocatellia bacterium]|nr:hypothetical protein [Blastocatellia bacterium]
MAVTAAAGKPLAEDERIVPGAAGLSRLPFWPRLGVRARQIALLTLLVALVVAVLTVANIAYLTGVIINRTEEQARQLTGQIAYAIRQELNHEVAIDDPNPYSILAREHSGVRGIMESIVVNTRPIAYLYVTNVSGKIITDKTGRNELAVNAHMIGVVPTNRPELSELAGRSAYVQLFRIFFGEPIYEYRKRLDEGGSIEGFLHIGVSATAVRSQLFWPIVTNLIIGLLAILGAAVV